MYLNRIEIKRRAKQLAGTHIWDFWKLMIYVLIVSFIFSFLGEFLITTEGPFRFIFLLLAQVAAAPISVGISWCLLSIVRGNKILPGELFKYFKYVWPIFFLQIIISILVNVGMICFIIPGIVLALATSMSLYIFADGETNAIQCIRKSMELTKGYKVDLLILGLSFIGWAFVGIFTFFILYIWLIPYIYFTITIYYEELRKVKQN